MRVRRLSGTRSPDTSHNVSQTVGYPFQESCRRWLFLHGTLLGCTPGEDVPVMDPVAQAACWMLGAWRLISSLTVLR